TKQKARTLLNQGFSLFVGFIIYAYYIHCLYRTFSNIFIDDHFVCLFNSQSIVLKWLFLLQLKGTSCAERRCDVQMNIALFVLTIFICPIITGIIANYLYDKFK